MSDASDLRPSFSRRASLCEFMPEGMHVLMIASVHRLYERTGKRSGRFHKAEAMRRAAGNATAVPAAIVINASGTPTMIQKMRRGMMLVLRQFQEGLRIPDHACGGYLALGLKLRYRLPSLHGHRHFH